MLALYAYTLVRTLPVLKDVSHPRELLHWEILLCALDRALDGAPPSCFIVEPVQGEGGVIVPDPGYFAEVSRICVERDCFLINDEILRAGQARPDVGYQRSGQAPGLMLVGKTLSGGAGPDLRGAGHQQGLRAVREGPDAAAADFRRRAHRDRYH